MFLVKILVPALAYYLAGKFGLMLAIPPGFASAVWPASGVALAAMLLHPKYLTCLGIGLGSFALNLGIAAGSYSAVTLATLPLPLCIALGASLQSYVGYTLFTCFVKNTHFDSPTNIAYFTLLVCPVGCLIAASTGATSLWSLGVIDNANVSFTWLTWWAGDTIGTLLFAPLLLILLNKKNRLTRTRKWQIAVPTIVIFTGITILFYLSTENQKYLIQHRINEAGRVFTQALEERLTVSENKLLAYNAFYNSSGNIRYADFEQFSQTILKNDDVFQGIGWTPIVAADQRQSFETRGKQEIHPNFMFTEVNEAGQIVPATKQTTYYPVFYVYPLEPNLRALGLNLGALPKRLSLLRQVIAQKKALATAPITLVQEQDEQKGIILYLPIYAAAPLSKPGQIDTPRGFISGVFRMQGLLENLVTRAEKNQYGIEFTDVSSPSFPIPLFNTSKPPLSGFKPITLPIHFSGRNLSLTFFANSKFTLGSKDWTSWSILTFGFLLAALFQAFILLITGTTENIKNEVERKTAELNEARLSAEKANQAKSNFLDNMSHELRTPLNAVLGFIRLTLKTKLSEEQQQHLNKAQLASSTLMSLINHTLDYSKIESGRFELENVDFNLLDVLEKIKIIFASQAEEKGIFFQLSTAKNLPHLLIGDPLRIEQILLNLCSNAIKFTHSGGVTLKFSGDFIDDEHIALEFHIMDSGIGIEASQQAQLFTAFSQAESGTTRQYGGTGLGLSICKKLIDAMSGTIALQSKPNIGTQIRVEICFKKAQAPYCELQANKHAAQETDPTTLAGLKILLVEDVQTNREIATYLLEDFGALVFTANNGQEALDFLASDNVIDIILMDIQMPVMDGYDATKFILENPETRHIPIIAMTANSIKTDVDACLQAGMQAHISKPFDERDVIDKVLKFSKK